MRAAARVHAEGGGAGEREGAGSQGEWLLSLSSLLLGQKREATIISSFTILELILSWSACEISSINTIWLNE